MLFKKKDQNESSKAKTALFASKAKQEEAMEKKEAARGGVVKGAETKEAPVKTLKQQVAQGRVSPTILRRPRITEKATTVSAYNIYTFDVATSANKKLVAGAVKDVYGITPIKIRIVQVPAKQVTSRRGGYGTTVRGKKAYVYLKKGDTIELV